MSLIARRVLGPRPHRFGWRASIAALMLLSTAYAGIVVAGRIRSLLFEDLKLLLRGRSSVRGLIEGLWSKL